MPINLYEGDCLEMMKRMPTESIDAIVTDPPGGISFMGKVWDSNKGGRDDWIMWMTYISAECLRLTKPGGYALVWSFPRTSHWTATAWENAGWEVRDRIAYLFGSGFPKSSNHLKPACEDWWLLRKPLSGTVAVNVMTHGTGNINIDECRVPTDGPRPGRSNSHGAVTYGAFDVRGSIAVEDTIRGRWPTNVIHDGSDEVMEEFAKYGKRGASAPVRGHEPSRTGQNGIYNHWDRVPGSFFDDTGTAARFFYTSKVSPKEREGSKHPTMKPLSLIRYLCRLITPTGGTVLDCFAGSGTTGLAAVEEGFNAILIEQESEYIEHIKKRLALFLNHSTEG